MRACRLTQCLSRNSELARNLIDLSSKSSPLPQFVVAPVQALMQPSPSRTLLDDLVMVIRTGQPLDDGGRDRLVRWLADHGYTRLDAVEDAGDFAVRGDMNNKRVKFAKEAAFLQHVQWFDE